MDLTRPRMTNDPERSRDRDLVDRMLAGDRDGFDQFFEENAIGLYRFALARVGNDEELAKEVVQTTLCRAVAGIETYRGEASLFTWLCTCCRYEILRAARQRTRRPTEVELDEDRPDIQIPSSSREDPEAELGQRETQELVHLTLDQIPGEYAAILELKYIDGVPVSEIARRLEISAKAAESRLTRARVAFRRRFRIIAGDPGIWRKLRFQAGARRSES